MVRNPRVFAASEWALIAAGLTQRLRALNRFLDDLFVAREWRGHGIGRQLLQAVRGINAGSVWINEATRTRTMMRPEKSTTTKAPCAS